MMMEQQKSSKITLHLVQPAIMCAGRKQVRCSYRGKIVAQTGLFREIKFKSRGKEVTVIFLLNDCITEGWQDLKLSNPYT